MADKTLQTHFSSPLSASNFIDPAALRLSSHVRARASEVLSVVQKRG
jgi:hypothetical protein